MRKYIQEWWRKSKGFVAGVALAGVFFAFIQARTADSYFEISKNLDIFNSVLKELNTYYVDPIEPGELVKSGIDNMLEDLDPYTNYITESDYEEYQFQTTGKYGGIGAIMKKTRDTIFVGDVYEDSPADKAGLHPGDRVISIAGRNTIGKSIDDISVLLKGAPGTEVVMEIMDAYTGVISEKNITRSEIELSSVPFAGLYGKNKDIAYVRLTQFTPHCSRLVKAQLDSLKKEQPELSGVVLDLRNNPGGLLSEAVSICNLFIEKGQLVVSTKGKLKDWEQEFKTNQQPWDTEIPVTVLINSSSASASEIVSGTIQDLDRGVVIGERSYGKGLVQTTRPVGYNSRLKLTTAKYYTPSGRCIQALDYTHRRPDGSVGEIPDSLKKEYKTSGGRKVLSGGGVEPDVNITSPTPSKLAITLYLKNYIFNYATIYAKSHAKIAPPSEFSMSESEYNAFERWLSGKEYSYKTDTEIRLDSLKSAAEREEYFSEIASAFKTLESKLKHDKKQDLDKHKDEIKDLLEGEIVSRYYYMRGRAQHNLRTDKQLDKALALLQQKAEYSALLKP